MKGRGLVYDLAHLHRNRMAFEEAGLESKRSWRCCQKRYPGRTAPVSTSIVLLIASMPNALAINQIHFQALYLPFSIIAPVALYGIDIPFD
jgi:hypothetical protein